MWFRQSDINKEDDLEIINKMVTDKLESIKAIDLAKKETSVLGSAVTHEMLEWYRIWKRAGRLSWDARPQLSAFYQQLTGSPIRDINCDGCIREAWERLEGDCIKQINKPL